MASLDQLLAVVCEMCSVSVDDVRSYRRHPSLILARRVFVLAAKRHTVATLGEAAAARGSRSPTSALYMLRAASRDQSVIDMAERAAAKCGLVGDSKAQP